MMDQSIDKVVINIAEPTFGIQVGKRALQVHSPDKCAGGICCIHNPSDHHMKSWEMNWRGDRGIMERLCTHGVGHPDPDDLLMRTSDSYGVHGCDGCCRPDTPKE